MTDRDQVLLMVDTTGQMIDRLIGGLQEITEYTISNVPIEHSVPIVRIAKRVIDDFEQLRKDVNR